MTNVLEISNISKTMGKKNILKNVSFTVNSGEVFGFLGPNGAGKTTTIKMVMGLLSIQSGAIKVNGYSVKDNFEKAMAHVGGIIENPEMYGYLSGWDNLKIFSRMHEGVTDERIKEVISLVKLDNRIHEKVKKYSLGMRQRLGVAQAILHKPNLLILDEPTNGLDPAGIKELRDTLHNLAVNDGVAVVVSSHLLSEMELMCDRFGIIDNGAIVEFISMKDKKENDDEMLNSITFETSDNEKSRDLIKTTLNTDMISLTEASLSAELTRDQIAVVNKALVENGISVYSIIPHKKTLEETFMEITSSGQIN